MTTSASHHREVRIGVIGLGFMGATHIAAYRAAAEAGIPCRVAAVCDRKASRRRGELWDVGGNAVSDVSQRKLAFDPSAVRAYERPEDLLADPDVQLVSLCTRTDTHVELAIAALRAGKHALVEKPVALRSADVRRIINVQRETGQLCVPAMCLRFWPQWRWLKQRIDDRTLGRCLSLTIQRLASTPSWSPFFVDGALSGGALVDLHIHDADFVRWCFGDPKSVSSIGRIGRSGQIDHVTTAYRYDPVTGPAHVVAEGGWDHHDGFSFRMRFIAIFENATIDYDLTRTPVMLLCRDGTAEPVETEDLSGYDGQARAVLHAILTGDRAGLPTLDEAAAVADLLDAERRSALNAAG